MSRPPAKMTGSLQRLDLQVHICSAAARKAPGQWMQRGAHNACACVLERPMLVHRAKDWQKDEELTA